MRKLMMMVILSLVCVGLSVYAEVPASEAAPEAAVEAVQGTENAEAVALCGRCGDGVCVPQCGENAISCPKDCAGQPKVACD